MQEEQSTEGRQWGQQYRAVQGISASSWEVFEWTQARGVMSLRNAIPLAPIRLLLLLLLLRWLGLPVV